MEKNVACLEKFMDFLSGQMGQKQSIILNQIRRFYYNHRTRDFELIQFERICMPTCIFMIKPPVFSKLIFSLSKENKRPTGFDGHLSTIPLKLKCQSLFFAF